MASMNLLIFLNSYEDGRSNNPSRSNFKWTRDINGIPAEHASSQDATLAISETKTIFTGSAVKKFLYIESDSLVNLTINGVAAGSIKPIIIGSSSYPGVFIRTSDITSLAIENPSTTVQANIFVASIE